MRTLEDIEADISFYYEQSKTCPYCPFGCYCDGDWSPESNLERLRAERAEVERKMKYSEK